MFTFEELAEIRVVVGAPHDAGAQMRIEGFQPCKVEGVWAKWEGAGVHVRATFEMVNSQDLPKLPWTLVPIGVCSETNTVLLERVDYVPRMDGI